MVVISKDVALSRVKSVAETTSFPFGIKSVSLLHDCSYLVRSLDHHIAVRARALIVKVISERVFHVLKQVSYVPLDHLDILILRPLCQLYLTISNDIFSYRACPLPICREKLYLSIMYLRLIPCHVAQLKDVSAAHGIEELIKGNLLDDFIAFLVLEKENTIVVYDTEEVVFHVRGEESVLVFLATLGLVVATLFLIVIFNVRDLIRILSLRRFLTMKACLIL